MTDFNGIYEIDLPVVIDTGSLEKLMPSSRSSSRMEALIAGLADEARGLARPRGIYKVSMVQTGEGSTTRVDSVTFTSKTLYRLLCNQKTVYPFIVTVGKDLDEWSFPRGEMMKNLCLEFIKISVLANAIYQMLEEIKRMHDIPWAAVMTPGSLKDWPITEQRPLFELFDNTEQRIRVSLTSGGAIKPAKSNSGIAFANESGFVSCQLCPKIDCPGRLAPYDPQLERWYLAEE